MATEIEPTAVGGPTETVSYVVQVRFDEVTDWQGEPCDVWRDMATIGVPLRTKRKTIIAKALERVEGKMAPVEGDPLMVRVLGPEDARAFKVSAVVRDPELRIEGA